MKFTEEVKRYKGDLDLFINSHSLPAVWFGNPDYIAVKTYTDSAYRDSIAQLKRASVKIIETWDSHGRTAAAQLLGRYALVMTLKVSPEPVKLEWVKVVEQADEEYDKPAVFDHAGMYVPRGLIPVRNVLNRRSIAFLPGKEFNPDYSWVSTIVDHDSADELRFADLRLEEIMEHKLRHGRARSL